MDISLLVAIGVMIISAAAILFLRGWKAGLVSLSFIFIMLIIYTLTIKFFGSEAKKHLAIGAVVIASIFLYIQKKKIRRNE